MIEFILIFFVMLQIDRICVIKTIKKIKIVLKLILNELNKLYRQIVKKIRK